MIRSMVCLLGIGFVIACPLRMEAQLTGGLPQLTEGLPLEVRVTDTTKTLERNRFNSNGRNGEEKKLENSYGAELRYTPIEGSIDGIKLRLITFFAPYRGKEKRKNHTPGKIQIRENISFQAGESKRIEFDPETYKMGEVTTQSGEPRRDGDNNSPGISYNTSYGGQEYVGAVLEVYHNDVLVGQRFNGLQEIRRVYEDWLEKDSPKLAQTIKKQGGPVLDKGTAEAPPGFFPPQNQDSSTPSGSGTKPAQPKKKQGGPVLIKPPGF